MAKIQLVAKLPGNMLDGTIFYCHSYILVTYDDGSHFYLRGGSTGGEQGNILGVYGEYFPGTPDYDADGGDIASRVLVEGDDATIATLYQTMVARADAINAANYPYEVFVNGSNAFAGQMLISIGLVDPADPTRLDPTVVPTLGPGGPTLFITAIFMPMPLPPGSSRFEVALDEYQDWVQYNGIPFEVEQMLTFAEAWLATVAVAPALVPQARSDLAEWLQRNYGLNAIVGNNSDNAAPNPVVQGTVAGEILAGLKGNDTLNGAAGSDRLYGGSGNDILNGGLGADRMSGGTGDDTYIVDNAGDTVVEAAGGGVDTVQSGLSYTLTAEVENLTLTGTAAIDGTGNTLDNIITGNAANNVLDGSAGADALAGGAGDDTYVVDNAGDTIVEAAGGGTDTARSSISYTLAAEVEHLTLTGAAAIDGTGNAIYNTLTGNSANNVLDGGAGADTLIGGAGDDTYIVDNASDTIVEVAGEGADTVLSGVSYVLAAGVENLTLTGALAIDGTGNALDNTLVGNSANNVLDGGAGADTLIGGAGDDTYIVDDAGDVVGENVGWFDGIDTVLSSISFTLAAEVENLTLTGAAAISGTGNALGNILTGNAASNVLDGGAGADALAGGDGDDTYVVDDPGDTVVEAASGGIDTVLSSVSFTLAAEVENLTLTGAAAISGTGNALGNTLIGNSAKNTLDGGAGADVLAGGAGNDTYIVDNAGDTVVEAAGGGTDTVRSSVTYLLGDDVERLTLIGSAEINGTGNARANIISGNSGNNTISGGGGKDTLNGGAGNDTLFGDGGADALDGGTGADTLAGGAGNDSYLVDNVGDTIVEAAGGGIDTVQSSVSYVLGYEVERLTLIGWSDINGTGNAGANIINGNSGANTISGGGGKDTLNGGAGNDTLYGDAGPDTLDGGTGADTLAGGAGNDAYVADNAGDLVIENAGQGIDKITTTLDNYTLDPNVEDLYYAGIGNFGGLGNELSNHIHGGSGNDSLTGGAGNDFLYGSTGNDLLNGGLGRDSFIFETASGPTNIDIIFDFSNIDDQILLNGQIFADAGLPGILASSAFFVGAAAHDADDRIIYDQATGTLSYDRDGNGAGAASQFAMLSPGLSLGHTNIRIF